MIRPLSLTQLAAQLPAALSAKTLPADVDVVCQRFSIDTRTLQPGDIFIALRGERFDGHDHVESAIAQGAIAVVVERVFNGLTVPQLLVTDAQRALGEIAAINRNQFTGQVLAITGSSGKTTVKAMVTSILEQQGSVLATLGNLNNHIGVPLTLLRLEANHKLAVIEMGASAAGEIAYLCSLARPTVTMINNVMPAHIAGFGSLAAIALAKSEIYQGLNEAGVALVNRDEPWVEQWLTLLNGKTVKTFSLASADCDAFARDITLFEDHSQFTLVLNGEALSVRLPIPGEHHVRNAVAAALAASVCGASAAHIQAGLNAFQPVSGRMVTFAGIQGSRVIDDSYNANPGSVKAAIDSLALQRGKRVLVLGEMGELGADSEALHAEVGRHALQKGIDSVFTVGVASRFASESAGGQHFSEQAGLIDELRTRADENTVFLIKGSRSARTDLIVAALRQSDSDSRGDTH